MERYITLENLFTEKTQFIEEMTLITKNMINGVFTYTQEELTQIEERLLNPMYMVIYDYYYNCEIACPYYDDTQVVVNYLNRRVAQQLAIKIPSYIVRHNLQKILSSLSDERYDTTSKMLSKSSEKGVSGSSVVQSSASTPTGINVEQTGGEIKITKTTEDETTTTSIEDDTFSSKYTNFQAKTNGVHDNDVSREGDVTRKGSLLDIITLANNLPQDFYDKVLKDVAYHFIFVY